MKFKIKPIVIDFTVVIVGILIYIALRTPEIHVSRELLIKTTPEVLFPYINSSKKADDWKQWSEFDPKVQVTYSGPEEGIGSMANWESAGPLGAGEVEIVESRLNQVVRKKLTYTKPKPGTEQLMEILLTHTADGTIVRISISGQNPSEESSSAAGQVIGEQLEKGLSKLKTIVEMGR